jgi:hypothetical protein
LIVRLTQLDGKLPNLALMRLSAWHRRQGDEVHFSRSPRRSLWEPEYDRVYASAIFDYSARHVEIMRAEFPGSIVGGTWDHKPGEEFTGPKVEDLIGEFDGADYSHWPAFTASLGFTQRGCRFKCEFCGVWKKEGGAHTVGSIAQIWRGEPWPRNVHLLDNDFFGQPKQAWKRELQIARDGGFRVCFSQGINIRVITPEIASELASIEYRDDSFRRRRLYTAWDSLGDEALFFKGVDRLDAAGVPPSHLMVYMLVGFDPAETWRAVFHRFNRMVARKIKPYVMVFGDRCRHIPLGGLNSPVGHQRLMDFQRWANTGLYRAGVDFAHYNVSARAAKTSKPSVNFWEAVA